MIIFNKYRKPVLIPDPAWIGFCSVGTVEQLEKIVKKAIKWELYSDKCPTLHNILVNLDTQLFKTVKNDSRHALHPLLPARKVHSYTMRYESFSLGITTNLQDKTFFRGVLKRF